MVYQYSEADINMVKIMLDQMCVQGVSQARILAGIGSVIDKGKRIEEKKENQPEQTKGKAEKKEESADGSRKCG